MKIPSWLICCALNACASLTLLAGCGGSQMPAAIPADGSQSAQSSWMAPDAKSKDLLYVANTTYGIGQVYVYSYPQGRLEGELAGASPADGLCSDKYGDVFVPEGSSILEFRHGDTEPIAALSDPYGGADYCAIDPVTGNLAVSPTVVIYSHAAGTGIEYKGGNLYGNLSCTYDNKGNLFINGYAYDGSAGPAYAQMGLVELRKNRSRFTSIEFPVLTHVGTIQWAGDRLAVGASQPPVIGRYRIVGKTAELALPFIFLHRNGDIGQFSIQGSTLVVPRLGVGGRLGQTGVYFYGYPGACKGQRCIDKPTKHIVKELNEPAGATISLAD